MSQIKEILVEILITYAIIFVLIITKYIKNYLFEKAESEKVKTNSTIKKNFINEMEEAIADSVTFVNQTFVDSLKNQNKFSIENQKIAFTMALDTVLSIVSQDAVDFIEESYGDVTNWISTKIESAVNKNKTIK